MGVNGSRAWKEGRGTQCPPSLKCRSPGGWPSQCVPKQIEKVNEVGEQVT